MFEAHSKGFEWVYNGELFNDWVFLGVLLSISKAFTQVSGFRFTIENPWWNYCCCLNPLGKQAVCPFVPVKTFKTGRLFGSPGQVGFGKGFFNVVKA